MNNRSGKKSSPLLVIIAIRIVMHRSVWLAHSIHAYVHISSWSDTVESTHSIDRNMSICHDTRVPVSFSAIWNAECKCTGQTRIAFNWVTLTWGACTRAVIAFLCLTHACFTTTSHCHNRQRHNVITHSQYFSSSKEADGEPRPTHLLFPSTTLSNIRLAQPLSPH
jgi:hypothetical protein